MTEEEREAAFIAVDEALASARAYFIRQADALVSVKSSISEKRIAGARHSPMIAALEVARAELQRIRDDK